MSNFELEDSDVDLGAAEAPHGLVFTEEAGDNLVNSVEAGDEFIIQEGIEGLLWLGYLTETVYLYGHTFTIKTLTRGERLACTLVAKEWEETLGLANAYEAATIGASLQFVDGQPFNPDIADVDPLARIRHNFNTLQDWYDPVLKALSTKVSLLHFRQQQAFDQLESK